MSEEPVVITGMGTVSALGASLEGTWEALLAGGRGIRPIRRFDPAGLPVRVAAELPPLLGALRDAGCKVLDVEVRSPSLHAVFIHLTGRDLRE